MSLKWLHATKTDAQRSRALIQMVNWLQLCTEAFTSSLQLLQQANYGAGIFAVSSVWAAIILL